MNASIISGAAAAVFALSATATFAQVSDKPFQENWAPSKWGKDDAAGSANHTKNSANIKRAISMIKQYKSVTLGKYYHREIPAVGTRHWNFVLTGTPNAGPFGENAMVYHDEFVSTEIGQIGTQFDGPGHIGVNTSKGMFLYNGRMYPESYERGPAGRAEGMGPNGVEYVGEVGFICRGIVLDAAAYRGVERLPIPKKPGDPGIVTGEDIKAIIKKQGIAEPQPGDCVFLHTGHGNIWGNSIYKKMTSEEHARARVEFGAGEPGFGISGCEYIGCARYRSDGRRHFVQRCSAIRREGYGLRGALPHRDADPAWNMEHREPGSEAAGRRESLRIRIHLVTAQDHRRHGLTRKSNRDLLISVQQL